ncbi:MAG TPA: hypothetical protein VLJ60_05370 [bacterium]|nr:hypothetical protein [bacterium]
MKAELPGTKYCSISEDQTNLKKIRVSAGVSEHSLRYWLFRDMKNETI